MDGAFERALSMRLRAELDGLRIAVPATSPRQARAGSMRLVLGVGRPLAVALGVALLLGSVAWSASGSPNPATWVAAAERTLGIPTSGDRTPAVTAPSPRSTESPEPTEKPNGAEREATGSPEPVERQSPEPTSPEPHDSTGPVEHTSGDG